MIPFLYQTPIKNYTKTDHILAYMDYATIFVNSFIGG